jgi:hypothetical protein
MLPNEQVALLPTVFTYHAFARFQEHDPEASEEDILNAFAASTEIDVSLVDVLTGRVLPEYVTDIQSAAKKSKSARVKFGKKNLTRRIRPEWELCRSDKQSDCCSIYRLAATGKGIFVAGQSDNALVIITYLRLPPSSQSIAQVYIGNTS